MSTKVLRYESSSCCLALESETVTSSYKSCQQVELFEVFPEECVFDGAEDKADVLGVGGTGVVRVEMPLMAGVLLHVHFQDERLCSVSVFLRPWSGAKEEIMGRRHLFGKDH